MSHNPYFNRLTFAIICRSYNGFNWYAVTILILIDWPLQYELIKESTLTIRCHNPYFNRLTFAIWRRSNYSFGNRWCHNPYFNRLTFAINEHVEPSMTESEVTILILIDWPLQYLTAKQILEEVNCHNPYFNRLTFAIYESTG